MKWRVCCRLISQPLTTCNPPSRCQSLLGTLMSPVAFLQRQLSRSCLSRRSRLLTTAVCAGTDTDRDMYSLVSGPQQAAFSGIQRSHQLRSGCSIPRTILAQQCHTSNHGRRHPGSAYLQPRHQPRYACFLLVGMRSEHSHSTQPPTFALGASACMLMRLLGHAASPPARPPSHLCLHHQRIHMRRSRSARPPQRICAAAASPACPP